jgi:hypothetical protein
MSEQSTEQKGKTLAAQLKAARLLIAKAALAEAEANKSGAKMMPEGRAHFAGQSFVQYAEARIAHWQAIKASELAAEKKRAGSREAKIASLKARIAALAA